MEFKDLVEVNSVSAPSANAFTGDVVFTVGHDLKKKGEGFKRAVWSVDSGGRLTRLTSGDYNDRVPSTSPDGSTLAFISDRKRGQDESVSSLYLVSMRGGEPWKAPLKGEVYDFRWLSDGSLMVLAADSSVSDKAKSERDELDFEHEHVFSSLWRVAPQTGYATKLTEGVQIWEFDCSSDGSTVVAVTSDLPYERLWYRSKISLIRFSDSKTDLKTVFNPGFRQVGSPRVSPDLAHTLFTCSLWSDRGVESGDLYLCDLGSQTVRNITEGSNYSVSWAEWLDHGSFMFLAKRTDSQVFFKARTTGEIAEYAEFNGSIAPAFAPRFSLGKGRIFFSAQRRDAPPELWSIGFSDSRLSVHTSFNQHIRKHDAEPVGMQPFKWVNRKGVEMTGFLRLPPDPGRSADKSGLPLVAWIHGGPTSSVPWSYLDTGSVFASKGYIVFYPNYTGSTGRGRSFAEANRGDMGGQDLQDILDGVEAVSATHPVDKTRVYITGGSYGGFMTMWAVTQTKVFAAAAALFGVSDWVSFHGTSNLSDWDEIHYSESPYNFERYDRFSPIRAVRDAATPTLLLHGEKDPYVPVGQSYEFYRALSDLGVETRLIVYPREGHGFREEAHFVDAYTRVLNWFETHVKAG